MMLSTTNVAIPTKRTRLARTGPRTGVGVLDPTVTLFDKIQMLTASRTATFGSSATMRRRRLLSTPAASTPAAQGSSAAESVRAFDAPSFPVSRPS
jgi:hypothetical protein